MRARCAPNRISRGDAAPPRIGTSLERFRGLPRRVAADFDDDILMELADVESRLRRLEGGSATAPAPARSWQDLYALVGADVPGGELGLRTADLAAATIAGLAGGVLDLQPTISSALTREDLHQRIDTAFKEKARQVTGRDGTLAIDSAVGGREHRLVGPTHDLFRLFTAIQLVRTGEFRSAVKGVLKHKTAYRDGLPDYLQVDSAPDALLLIVMHWSADFFSKMSLPIPGWSKLAEVNDREFVMCLFRAYRGGANLRSAVSQFASNLSGLALISILLHLYRYIDLLWVTECVPIKRDHLNLADDLRFRWMSRNANLTALSVSTAHAVVVENFFSWNYMSFCKFYADARAVERILDRHHAELDDRCDRLLRDLAAGGF